MYTCTCDLVYMYMYCVCTFEWYIYVQICNEIVYMVTCFCVSHYTKVQ